MGFFLRKILREYKKIPFLFKFLVIAILFLRIILFTQPSFQIDMIAWQAWSARLVQVGPMNFYDTNIWTNYTPGYLFFLWIIGLLFNGIFNVPFFSSTFIYIIKFITTIFDIATAILIFKILKEYGNKSWSILGFTLYLGNPAVIFNSSVWGQIDGILTFFILLSLYLIIEKHKPSFSSAFFAQAFFIKPQAIAVFPLYVLIILQNFKKKFIGIITVFFLIFMAYALLFFPKDIFSGFVNLVIKMTKDYSFTSLYTFNMWSILGWWQNDAIKWMGLSYALWGFLMYILALVLIIIPSLIKQNKDKFYSYLLYSLLILAFYLFPTRVHERYLLPFFAFFLIAALLKKSRLFISIYIIVSIINFINLWFVYYYYNFIYSNPILSNNMFYGLIEQNYKLLAATLIFCFSIILFFYYRLKFYAKKQ